MRLFAKKQLTQEDVIKHELNITKKALECAYSNFENVIDPDLIDCSIYELNAVQKRYHFLLKQAKALDKNYSHKKKMH